MLRDAIGLIIAFFILIVEYSVMSPFFVQFVTYALSLNEHSATLALKLKAVYMLIHGVVAVGIIFWYLHRSHREEVEIDYFARSGWTFQMPRFGRRW